MVDQDKIQAAADRLWKAAQTSTTCSPIRDLLGTEDLESAYQAQAINTKRKEERGEKVLGYKVGLTSEAVQTQLGVDQPDFGVLTDVTQVQNNGSMPASDILQPKIEAEIGFVLNSDLGSERPTMDSLVAGIEGAIACLEIVGSRIENWNIRITDTIADNASASHFVLGDSVVSLDDVDLVNCKMNMTRNGETVSEGIGSACLGNPLNAALWLAQIMYDFGTPMRAGHIILAGALGPMCPVVTGDGFTASIEGFDPVSVSFE